MKRVAISIILLCFSLLFASSPYSQSINTLIIDAGHGGEDPGAVGKEIVEKEVTLAIALRLKEIVEKKSNLTVVQTRLDDSFLELEQRVAISNSTFPGWNNSALFISIHVNGSISSIANGYEFLVRESRKSAPFISPLSDDWALSYFANDSITQLRRDLNQASYGAAHSIRKAFNNNLPSMRDRGIKEQDVYVINNNIWPSVLIEAGFVTNEEEATFMQDPSWIESVAQSIWEGISSYML